MRIHDDQSPVTETSERFTIGQVARLTGVNAKTIRYYESVSLLPAPSRSANSYRRYGQADVNRLILLQRIRSLGAPLTAARTLLAETSTARCAEVRDDLLALIDDYLLDLDQQIAALQRRRAEALRYQRAVGACQPDPAITFSACGDAQFQGTPCDMSSRQAPIDDQDVHSSAHGARIEKKVEHDSPEQCCASCCA